MIAPRDVPVHELIGQDVLVAAASNPFNRGVSGSIVDETKNMLVIKTVTGVKQIPKQHSIFRLNQTGSRVVEIDGSVLMLAPEKRISLLSRKRIP
jgi:ribonuclease P protein subunit POP4